MELKTGEYVDFELAFANDSPPVLKGSGLVRWARSQSAHADAAAGIEIRWLDPEWREAWLSYIKGLNTYKFIPNL
jgi:hypothetical protein